MSRFLCSLCVVALCIVGGAASRQPGDQERREGPSTRIDDPLRVYCGWRGADYAPFHRWDPSAPAPVGLEPDLIGRVAATLKRSVVFVEPSFGSSNARVQMLARGHADLVISTFSITPERSKHVAFSRPYFIDGLGALVRSNAPFQSPNELSSKRLYVVHGTTGEAWVRSNWPQAKLVRPTYNEISSVASGQVDGYLNDRSHLVKLAIGDQRVRVLPGYLTREPWGIAVARNNTTLLAQINGALSSLETSGELATIQRRWLGP